MPPQVLTNSSFQINDDRKALTAFEEMFLRSDVVTRESVTKSKEVPAARVIMSKAGVELLLSWCDGSKTLLHIDVPLRSPGSYPLFRDFSSVATMGRDTLIKFTSDTIDAQTENLKAGRPALLLRIQLFLADLPNEPTEYFSVFRKDGKILLGHKNISAVVEVAPAPKPVEDEPDVSLDDLVLPNLTERPASDDSGSWDVDELLRGD